MKKNYVVASAIIFFLLLLIFRGCFYDPNSQNIVGDFFETIIGFAIVIAILYAIGKAANKRTAKEDILKERYDTALRGKDKNAALRAGRAYYQHLRGFAQPLTIYDEQAIANDINTMNL